MSRNININPAIRERVKTLRENAGLTKQQLADEAGVSFPTIHHLENGESHHVREHTIHQIARVLGVAYRDIVYEEEPAEAAEPEHVDSVPAEGESGPEEPGPERLGGRKINPVPRWWIAAGLSIVIGMIAVVSFGLLRNDPEKEVLISADWRTVVVRDRSSDRTVCQWESDCEVRADWIPDSGKKSVVIGTHSRCGDLGHVVAYDAESCKLLWEDRPDYNDLKAVYGPEMAADGTLRVIDFYSGDVDGDGSREIIAKFAHQTWYPGAIRIYRSDGLKLGTYYTCGSIYDVIAEDIDDNGKDEIIVSATNNTLAYQGGMVMLLDDVCCSGASADSLALALCERPDSARARVVFPQFEPEIMARLGQGMRLHAYGLRTYRTPTGEVRILVEIGMHEEMTLIVTMDANLRPLSVAASDRLLQFMRTWPEELRARMTQAHLDAWLSRHRYFTARPLEQLRVAGRSGLQTSP